MSTTKTKQGYRMTIGLEVHVHRVARNLPLERLLERSGQAAVPAVQVHQRLARLVQQRALRVVQLDGHRHHLVALDRIQAQPLLSLRTTSNTSAAWPRGLTP